MFLILLLSTTLASPLPSLFLPPSPTTLQAFPPYGVLTFLGRFPRALPSWQMHTDLQGQALFLNPDGTLDSRGSREPEAVLYSLRAREDSRIFLLYGQPIHPRVALAGGFFSTTYTGEQLSILRTTIPGGTGLWVEGKEGDGSALSWLVLRIDTGSVHLFAFRERPGHWEVRGGWATRVIGYRQPDGRTLLGYRSPQGIAGIASSPQTHRLFPYASLNVSTPMGSVQVRSDLDPVLGKGVWWVRARPGVRHPRLGTLQADLELTSDTVGIAGGWVLQGRIPGNTPLRLEGIYRQAGDDAHGWPAVQDLRLGLRFLGHPAPAYQLEVRGGVGRQSTTLPVSFQQWLVYGQLQLRFADVFLLHISAGTSSEERTPPSPYLSPPIWWRVLLATWIVD